MTSSLPVTAKAAHHPQRQKLVIRKSSRKLKDLSTQLANGEAPAIDQLHESEAALKIVYEACTGVNGDDIEKDVEVILGSLPRFLAELKGNLDGSIEMVKDGPAAESGKGGRVNALEGLLALITEWHRRLQERVDEASQTRKAWEEEHPVQVAQEHELSIYIESLQPLLDAPSARAVSAKQWQEAETSLASLQVYLLDNKISAEQIKGSGGKGIEAILRDLLRQMEEWDTEGLGFQKDDRVNLQLLEKIWGRADKIGSGLNYLLVIDARGDVVDGVKPTTRSVFLLKSAPPAQLRFSPSKDALLVKKLSESRERLVEIVLSPNQPDIKRDDEARWNAAYRELEALEKFVKREHGKVSQMTIKESRIEETIGLLRAKLESLHVPVEANEDDSAFALMYISWELTMRIGHSLGVLPDAGPECEVKKQ